jgi:hypothetical protein
MRPGEVHLPTGIPLDHLPEGELAPAVIGERARLEFVMGLDRRMHGITRTVRDEINDRIQALLMHMGEQTGASGALHGIALPAQCDALLDRADETRPTLSLRPF